MRPGCGRAMLKCPLKDCRLAGEKFRSPLNKYNASLQSRRSDCPAITFASLDLGTAFTKFTNCIWHFRHLLVILTSISRIRSLWPTFMKIVGQTPFSMHCPKCGLHLRLHIKFNRWDTRYRIWCYSDFSLVGTYICWSLWPTFTEIWIKFISLINKMVNMTHIYLHTKYWVTATHFLWNICQNMLPG